MQDSCTDLLGESKNVYKINRTRKAKQEFSQNDISVYQRANLDFDILLEILGANLAEIFKFKKDRMLKKWQKSSIIFREIPPG